MAKLELEVTVEPYLVECNLVCKISHSNKTSISEPTFMCNLTLDDFNQAMELLKDYKNNLK